MDHLANALVDLWFGDWSDERPAPETGDPIARRWWVKDPDFDQALREQFGEAHAAASAGDLDHWMSTPHTAVALILLLDQVSRNIHRDTPRAFEADPKARTLVHRTLGGALWEQMPPIWRYFVIMPLMHSESMADHDVAVQRFTELANATAATARAGNYSGALSYEHKHRDIIERFGRYPHRNAILGRASTEEEVAFLTQPGSSF